MVLLKQIPQAELNLPGRPSGEHSAKRGRIVYETLRQIEIRVVEAIEKLGAKLKVLRFGNAHILEQGKIKVAQARADQYISACISESIALWNGKGIGIEESLRHGIVQM